MAKANNYTFASNFPQQFRPIVAEGYKKINAIWPITQKIHFITCTGRTRNGFCRQLDKTSYEIAINKNLIKSNDILEVIMHELLHSYPTIFDQNHGGEWAKRAKIIYAHYGVLVQRTNSFEKIGLAVQPKKIFQCSNCLHSWKYYKTPKWYSHLHEVTCPYCGKSAIEEITQ